MQKPNDMLWESKYRPSTISECILPTQLKKFFEDIVTTGKLPNLLLCSTMPGTGKTTVARALVHDLDFDSLFINASEMSGIDTLRTIIRDYASSYSIDGRNKVVILDEFDQTSDSFQKAFRGFIEEFSTVRFILTANYVNKVIKPIRSRMSVEDFVFPDDERLSLIKQGIIRCGKILALENIPCDNKKVLMELVRRNYPDNRSVLVDLQKYSRTGQIDEGILGKIVANDDISEFISHIQSKSFASARALIPMYANDYTNFIGQMYRKGILHIDKKSTGEFILILAENMKYAGQVADMELHIASLVIELMSEVEWAK
ncbi:DNA polymerase clamp loader subunit [Paraglaciecola Antarctic GD virus 1]|nr:DNA polymerase clamp loader subunit [Paraglaciecola Antarctic GD virus 1]